MKTLLLTFAFLVMSISAFARTELVTYDLVDETDTVIGELVVEMGKKQVTEHWVIYPDPDKRPITNASNPLQRLDGVRLIKSDLPYATTRELQKNMQEGDRYFRKVSVEIAPLPSP